MIMQACRRGISGFPGPAAQAFGMGRDRRSAPIATYVNVPSVTFTVPLSSKRRAQASTCTVTLVFGCHKPHANGDNGCYKNDNTSRIYKKDDAHDDK